MDDGAAMLAADELEHANEHRLTIGEGDEGDPSSASDVAGFFGGGFGGSGGGVDFGEGEGGTGFDEGSERSGEASFLLADLAEQASLPEPRIRSPQTLETDTWGEDGSHGDSPPRGGSGMLGFSGGMAVETGGLDVRPLASSSASLFSSPLTTKCVMSAVTSGVTAPLFSPTSFFGARTADVEVMLAEVRAEAAAEAAAAADIAAASAAATAAAAAVAAATAATAAAAAAAAAPAAAAADAADAEVDATTAAAGELGAAKRFDTMSRAEQHGWGGAAGGRKVLRGDSQEGVGHGEAAQAEREESRESLNSAFSRQLVESAVAAWERRLSGAADTADLTQGGGEEGG
ncbi:hypothetical protein T492DRAFT_1145332, partial [Pavlovales sp. CCMP2436]